jgi:uncharacterized LabA/DUF88 family protein
MLKAMVFVDFENFEINKNAYYKSIAPEGGRPQYPKLDYNVLPQKIVEKLTIPHYLVKSFLFAPKPDDFLMKDDTRARTYNWINGMKNQNYFTIVEGSHSARPVSGFTYQTMDINNRASYYIEEKGTDVNLGAHLITKGFMNAYDTAIVMSGDTDYIPAMDILNTLGKTVVVVGVKNQNLFQFKRHTDAQIVLDDAFFQSCLR